MKKVTMNPHHGSSVNEWFAEEEAREPGWLARIDEEIEREVIAAKVRYARERAGVTQTELARRVGTRQPGIARVESGKVVPTLDLLQKIAHALELSLAIGFAPKKATPARVSKKRSAVARKTDKRRKMAKSTLKQRKAARRVPAVGRAG
jgi:transcriptional regulator with XRE-family HTH domain